MVGLIGKKVGMTQVFDSSGLLTPVTVIEFDKNLVLRRQLIDGSALLAAFNVNPRKLSSPLRGQFGDGVTPKRVLRGVRNFPEKYAEGDLLGVEVFASTRYVDIIGTSKGKGFAGVMKRYGFGGGRASHGSKFHREPGSTGQSATPSNTKRGRKMPGRMGANRVTAQNLRVVELNVDLGIMVVRGAVPGVNNGVVLVRQATKRK